MASHSTRAPVTEFQTVLRLMPGDTRDDRTLEEIAELSLNALRREAAGLALGVVAAVDLDQRVVELEMTIEAPSDAELHQKMGLIVATLERGAPLQLWQSTASRSQDRDLVCA